MEPAAEVETSPPTDVSSQDGVPISSGNETEFVSDRRHIELFGLALKQSIKGMSVEEIIAMLKAAAVEPSFLAKQRRGKHFKRFSEFRKRQKRPHRRRTGENPPSTANAGN